MHSIVAVDGVESIVRARGNNFSSPSAIGVVIRSRDAFILYPDLKVNTEFCYAS